MPFPARLLKSLSVDRLEELLRRKRAEAKLAPLEKQRARLARRLATVEGKIAKLTGGAAETAPKKRTFSAATRRKMALAQQARWAAKKGTAKAAAPKKRKFSPAARAAMRAGSLRRWAAVRAAKESAGQAKPRRKHKMSAAGRAAIIAGVKKRMARQAAAKAAVGA